MSSLDGSVDRRIGCAVEFRQAPRFMAYRGVGDAGARLVRLHLE